MENNPTEKDSEEEKNFAKVSPERQRELSKEHTPPDHDEPAINEKLALENKEKYIRERARINH